MIKQYLRENLRSMANKKQLVAYKHENFWQCMDTLRDKELLNKLFMEEKHLG